MTPIAACLYHKPSNIFFLFLYLFFFFIVYFFIHIWALAITLLWYLSKWNTLLIRSFPWAAILCIIVLITQLKKSAGDKQFFSYCSALYSFWAFVMRWKLRIVQLTVFFGFIIIFLIVFIILLSNHYFKLEDVWFFRNQILNVIFLVGLFIERFYIRNWWILLTPYLFFGFGIVWIIWLKILQADITACRSWLTRFWLDVNLMECWFARWKFLLMSSPSSSFVSILAHS
jgi:hypothetical protein